MADKMIDKYNSNYLEPISLKVNEKIINQMKNSICRIYNNDKGNGIFVKIPYKSRLLPVLITTNHIINQDDIHKNRSISLNLNNDIVIIKLENNRIMYTNEKLDITIIEIKENNLNINYLEIEDEMINFIKLNNKEKTYYLNNLYINDSIYSLNYYKDNEIFVSYGKLININNSDIFYNCNTKGDSLGSPILLLNNQKLIGIHCGNSIENKYNKGRLLIYSIIEFSKMKNELLLINKEGKIINQIFNCIIGELNIKEAEQDIRIINSYDQYCRENEDIEYKKEYENEKEIKENCEIRLNGKLIPFSYFYKFNKKGKYIILYNFKKNITKTNYMFRECSSLTNINLTYFNTHDITDMNSMFSGCSSLKILNLSNFNTNNVINMSGMFFECSSLKKLNLSNFNTKKVTDKSYMFCGCKSLKNLNLSNFNTNNVKDMSLMFDECSSLKKLNLSNFNTNNVKDMSNMFDDCSSLTNIDIFNFNINNVTNMGNIFSGCKNLTKNNIIINDLRILMEFDDK